MRSLAEIGSLPCNACLLLVDDEVPLQSFDLLGIRKLPRLFLGVRPRQEKPSAVQNLENQNYAA